MRSGPLLLLAVCAVTLISGCTSQEPGTAIAEPDGTSTGSSESGSEDPSGSEKPTVDIPPPPKNLPLDGVDPCALFTTEQRAALEVSRARKTTSDSEHYNGMQVCVLDVESGDQMYSFDVMAATNEGVDAWLTGKRNAEAELISIDEYPAARFNTLGVDTDCVIALGVADGQHLQVEMAPLTDGFTQEDICQAGEQAAAMALGTLQTLK